MEEDVHEVADGLPAGHQAGVFGWEGDEGFEMRGEIGEERARQYGVDGIPHTVIVGPDGKAAWVKTGYSADGELEASAAVKKLLEAPGPPALRSK